MTKFFTSLYKFFENRKSLMYTILGALVVFSVYFGLKVQYEEDITKLLPSAATSDSGLAFGNLKVKDKIFIQITSRDTTLDIYTLSSYADEFVDSLMVRDSASHCIDNVLYRIDDDLPFMALDFAMAHVPSFVDTSCYSKFETLLTPHAVDSMMAVNYETVMNDETGSATQMVSTDPLGLRNVLAGSLGFGKKDTGSSAGFTIIDSHLFCADSTVALAFVSPALTAFDTRASSQLVGEIESLAEEFTQLHPDAQVYYHGAPVRSFGNSRVIKRDLFMTVGISLIIILIVLCLSFRSFSFIPMNVLPVAFGAFVALAFMYFLKGTMSLMALGIGSIILGVAISYILHILTHFKYVGDSAAVLKDESVPVCLGCLTTVGAFLGLLFTESDLLRDFGIFASVSLVASTLFGLIFLPHFLKKDDTLKNEKVFAMVAKFNDMPYDKNKWLIGGVIALIVVGVVFSGKVTFDSDLKNIGYVSPQTRASEELYAQKNLGNDVQVYFAAAGESLDEALVNNKALVNVCDSMQQAGMLTSYSKMASVLFVPEAEQQERIAKWNSWWNGGDGLTRSQRASSLVSDAARKYGLDPSMFAPFTAMLEADYEPGSLYEEQILPDGLSTTLVEKMDDGRFLMFTPVKLKQDLRMKVSDRLAELPHIIVADPFYYTGNMVSIVHDDFNVILLISSIFVLIVLLISFRNILVALIAFMPMAFSWYVVEGLMALFGIQFNLINIIISTFIFGIGVDYSIFVMEGLLAEARSGRKSLLEWHKTAIFFSAFVLIVVVLSMFFATHPAIRSIGFSTLVGMVTTILITYTLEPFFFRQMLKIRRFAKRITK